MCDCSAAVLEPLMSFHFNLLESFFLILGNEQTLMKIPKEKVNEISHGSHCTKHLICLMNIFGLILWQWNSYI